MTSLLDQLSAAGSPSPLTTSALVLLGTVAAAAASGALSPAPASAPGFALLPAFLRLDTGGLARRYGIQSRQSAFRTRSRPGLFPA